MDQVGKWLQSGSMVYELELARRPDHGTPELQNRWWAFIQGPPSTTRATLEQIADRIRSLPEIEMLLADALDFCRSCVAAFADSDMRPEDQCHELSQVASGIIDKAAKLK